MGAGSCFLIVLWRLDGGPACVPHARAGHAEWNPPGYRHEVPQLRQGGTQDLAVPRERERHGQVTEHVTPILSKQFIVLKFQL